MNTKPTTYNRFEVGTTCIGWEVVDSDGRPVSEELDYNVARRVKDHLNTAAASGPKVLAKALGAVEEYEDLLII